MEAERRRGAERRAAEPLEQRGVGPRVQPVGLRVGVVEEEREGLHAVAAAGAVPVEHAGEPPVRPDQELRREQVAVDDVVAGPVATPRSPPTATPRSHARPAS